MERPCGSSFGEGSMEFSHFNTLECGASSFFSGDGRLFSASESDSNATLFNIRHFAALADALSLNLELCRVSQLSLDSELDVNAG